MSTSHLEEADVRAELVRQQAVCGECRRCVDLCTAFPTLFDLLAQRGGDPGLLTPADQDRVVDECHHCSWCAVGCPHAEADAGAVDIPRLMLRAVAVRRDALGVSARLRRAVGRVLGATAGGVRPPFARDRFTPWFRQRPTVSLVDRDDRVTVVPTCLVEERHPGIGHDLVKVYERNGIECRLSDVGCCGAPWLHAGETRRFASVAASNVAVLAAEIRDGADVVVATPSCAAVLRDSVEQAPGEDAELVAAHVHDAAEYLLRRHEAAGGLLDVRFGDVPAAALYHGPRRHPVAGTRLAGRDLVKLTGAEVRVVCSNVAVSPGDALAGRHRTAAGLDPIIRALEDGPDDLVVVGDEALANEAIAEQSGRATLHPMQVLARAYGIADES